MTRHHGISRTCALVGALLALAGAKSALAAPYSIDILINPYHPGIADSWLFDIDNDGQAAGYIIYNTPSGPRSAVTYRNGVVTVLGSGPGTIRGINSHGDSVGVFNFAPRFIASGGAETPIEVPENFVSLLGGLNDSGNVLINSFPNDPADMPPNAFAGLAIWNLGGTNALSVLDPLYPYVNPPDPEDFLSGPSSSAYTSRATRLNNANQFAAGVHQSDFDPVDPNIDEDDLSNDVFTQAYVYNGQGGYSLLESPTPGEEIRPIDIDEAGTVLGSAGDRLALWGPNGALQKFLPDSGTPLNILGFNGYPSVQRNSLGQVVAVTLAGGVMFYDPVSNGWTDVTSSINGLGTGTFSSIQGFNDSGQFVGLVRPPAGGGVYGYVVTPVPEPTSLAICMCGLALLAAARPGRVTAPSC